VADVNQLMKEISDRIAEEGRARHDASMACLKAIKKAADENNSSTAKAFAEAFEKVRFEVPKPQFGVPMQNTGAFGPFPATGGVKVGQ